MKQFLLGCCMETKIYRTKEEFIFTCFKNLQLFLCHFLKFDAYIFHEKIVWWKTGEREITSINYCTKFSIRTIFFLQISFLIWFEQISFLRERYTDLEIEVDGGVSPSTIQHCADVSEMIKYLKLPNPQLTVWKKR